MFGNFLQSMKELINKVPLMMQLSKRKGKQWNLFSMRGKRSWSKLMTRLMLFFKRRNLISLRFGEFSCKWTVLVKYMRQPTDLFLEKVSQVNNWEKSWRIAWNTMEKQFPRWSMTGLVNLAASQRISSMILCQSRRQDFWSKICKNVNFLGTVFMGGILFTSKLWKKLVNDCLLNLFNYLFSWGFRSCYYLLISELPF